MSGALIPSGRTAQRLGIALTFAAILLSLSTRGRLMLHTMGPLHAWYHLALFAILGLLAMRSSTKLWVRFAWVAAAILLGLGIEYMEAVRYHIQIEIYDVRTDTSGVALGGFIGWLFSRRSA